MTEFESFFERYQKENEKNIKEKLSFVEGCWVRDYYGEEFDGIRYWVTLVLNNGEVVSAYSRKKDYNWMGKEIRCEVLCYNEDRIISVKVGNSCFLPLVKWKG